LREVGSPSIAQDRDPHAQNRIADHVLKYLYRYAARVVALTGGARRDLRENFAVPAARIQQCACDFESGLIDRNAADQREDRDKKARLERAADSDSGKNRRNCGEADGRRPRQRREVFEMVNTEIGEACSLRAEAVDDQRHAKMKTQRPYSAGPATRENIAAAS